MLTVNDLKLYTAAEARDLTGLSRHAILRLAIQGVIHPVMHGRRAMYRDDELTRLISGEIRPPRRSRTQGPYCLDPDGTIPLPKGTEWLDTQDLVELGYARRGLSAMLKRRHERHPGTVVFNAAGRRVGLLKQALGSQTDGMSEGEGGEDGRIEKTPSARRSGVVNARS